MIWGVCDLLRVMHSHNCELLPRRAASQFVWAGQCMLQSYSALVIKAKDLRQPLWCVKPKHHLVSHLIDNVHATCENPNMCWAFSDEDFNGAMVKLCVNMKATQFDLSTMEKSTLRIYLALKR